MLTLCCRYYLQTDPARAHTGGAFQPLLPPGPTVALPALFLPVGLLELISPGLLESSAHVVSLCPYRSVASHPLLCFRIYLKI
jgi:hypothetical protein